MSNVYIVSATETAVGPDAYSDNHGRMVQPELIKLELRLLPENLIFADKHNDLQERHRLLCQGCHLELMHIF